MTVYSITAVQYAEQLAKGTSVGIVPAKMSVSGETVKDVLVGKSQESGKKTILGLVEQLNKLEEDELKKGEDKSAITYKNEYKIVFDESTGIGDALLVPKDYYVKEKTPMATVEGGVANSNERTAWKKRLGTVEKKTRNIEIPAGLPIIQVIDNIISQSEYIKNMMVATDKEIDDKIKGTDKGTDINARPNTLSWYNINTTAKRISAWDDKRKDYAHEITYHISKYEIPYVRSLYSDNYGDYYGPHKRYQYWYTGKNSEILSYEQDYNMSYLVEGAMATGADVINNQSAKTKLRVGQVADSTTTKSGKNDIVNSIKSFLYSPGDLVHFKLRILGDPDYLMPSIGTGSEGGTNKWYGSDFSINPNAGQIFFEISFQQVEDYDNHNGLMTPNSDIQFADYPAAMRVQPKGIVYMLTHVTSTFSKGKFEQTLKGSIPEFVNSGELNARESTPPETTANPRQETKPVVGGGRGGQGGPTASQINSAINDKPSQSVMTNKTTPAIVNPISKVADDDSQSTTPPLTYTGPGREPVVIKNPLTKAPTGKSVMFNNNK